MTYKLSVVMPALNEEGNIANAINDVVSTFERLSLSGEIVVINDGSTDRTAEIISRLQASHPFIQVIKHATPQGIGKSFWDGVKAAQGEVVTMLPGDAENDAYEILRYLPLMDQVDIVVPFVFNRESRSPMRQFISLLYRGFINLSFGTSLNYMNGTVMYRRSVLKDLTLRSNGFFFQTELLVKSLRAGYLYAEVPYGLKRREGGKSKALTLKSLRRVMSEYLRTVASVYFAKEYAKEVTPESISARRQLAFSSPTPDQPGLLSPSIFPRQETT